jgi:6-phosphogluconolactonase
MIQEPRIRVFPDPHQVADEAARQFIAAAQEAVRLQGHFSVALAGGSTPKAMYALLAEEPYRSQLQWERVKIYFGDERCVPPDHPDSNYRMANETLLKKVPIPLDNVYRMEGECKPEAAAMDYGRLLKEAFGDEGGLDLILLGMGDDGHTASLFPHTAALAEQKHRCVANYVEKLKTWRITLSAPFINRARLVLFTVVGAAKASRVAEVLEGPRDPERLPSQLIAPTQGVVLWLLDAAAAAMNED